MNYTILAPIYDRIMCHVRYDLWLKLIQRVVQEYCVSKKPDIFELGCGTGVLARMLQNHGFPYYGSDFSHAMCKESYKKNIPVICANALYLPLKRTFSLIIFLYDGINYLKSLEQFSILFHEVYRYLNNQGLFLFDITTESNSLTNFRNHIDAEDFGESSYIRHSYYNREEKIQHNDFTLYNVCNSKSFLFKKQYEFHKQRIFSVKEILSTIPQDCFSVLGIWDNFTSKKYHARSERIHFLLKKKTKF